MAIRDVRLELVTAMEQAARADAPARRCVVCDVKLPKGLERTRCLAHSEYVQRLIQRERRPGLRVA
jgi:hypothetical protein